MNARSVGLIALAFAGALASPAPDAYASAEAHPGRSGSALDPAPGAGASAKPARKPRILPGNFVPLKTKDGWGLGAQYSPAKPGRLTFVLLHQTGGRKEDWYFLAKAMVRRGYGVMAVDLRGHGSSENPPPGGESTWRKFRVEKNYNEFNNMALDVDAAVEYLKGQGVAETSIALGGADVGSSVALRYGAVHPEAPLVFMLSPGMSYREVQTVNAIRAYKDRPILMIVGSDDRHSVPETAILHEFARRSVGDDRAVQWTVDREHGTRMLTMNKGLIARLVDWIENPVQPTQASAASTQAVPGQVFPENPTTPAPPPTEDELDNNSAPQ